MNESPEKSFSTSRPVAVLMIFAAAVVFGFFSYGRLPITLMPELSYPTLTVRTEYPGAAPEEVENDISRPIEDALGVVSGLTRVSSISRAGVSDVVLEFAWNTEMSEALQDTLEKLDLVLLPPEAEKPLILRFDPSLDPVLELTLAAKDEGGDSEERLRRLRRLAELQVRRALEPVAGVAAVRLRGGLEEEIHVQVDDEQLRRTGISLQRLIDRLGQENVNVAGGTIQEGRAEYMVRTLNEFQNLDQIKNLVVATVEGRDVRVRDLAKVELGHKERQILTRGDGLESVQIDIYKEADANMVALSKAVRARLGTFDPNAKEPDAKKKQFSFGPPGDREGLGGPKGLKEELFRNEGVVLDIVADRSIFIENSINEVTSTAISGGFLAIAVLFLFLRNARSTLIIGVSIPISLLITFAPLNLAGISLNIMSLGGLALGVGMLVDNSIVVLESIFRCREEGDSLIGAAVRGTSEVYGAVISSTLTTVAVFFPMVFVEGVAGQAFGDLGIAVVGSLLASLWVALTFIPMLASRGIEGAAAAEPTSQSKRPRFASWADFHTDLEQLHAWRAGGGWRLLVVLIAWLYLGLRFVLGLVIELVVLISGVVFFAVGFVFRLLLWRPVRFFYERLLLPLTSVLSNGLEKVMDLYGPLVRFAVRKRQSVVTLTVFLLVLTVVLAFGLGSELLPEIHQGELTAELTLPVGTPLERTDEILRPLEQEILRDKGEIKSLLVTLGYDPANSKRSDEGEHTARFKVLLTSSDARREDRVIERLRALFAQVPDLETHIVRPVLFSFRTPIEIEIQGDDLAVLKRSAEVARTRLAGLPELADVESTLKTGAPEMQILYDRDLLARADLDILRVAELVRDSVKGFEATRFNLRDRRIPIVVRFSEDERAAVEDVEGITVNPGGARPIPLSAVAKVELGEGPSEVRRIDGRRVALVRANLGEGSLGNAVERVLQELDEIEWPASISHLLTGQSLEWNRSQASLLLALALSIFLVYVIMAAQFESLVQPLVIMLTIPLAFLGTFIALHLLGLALSIVVFLGMIILAGIVVNNAIVLVDYTNTLRSRGMALDEAVVLAGSVRLRPILMTTSTTVLGLMPMAFGLGDGAEIRQPMAVAVISGLLMSTVLTLLIIPTLYAMVEELREKMLGRSPIAS
jgi:hydrophobic/amphiphilic exporter-1 (mainly G- bacteria), HAE1 family